MTMKEAILSSGGFDKAAVLADLDPLMIALGLALAASAPGPAGEAGAVAAISFDVSKRRWYGVALSAASMIPVIGYLPALFKVGLLLNILGRRLKAIEELLPELHQSAEDVEYLRDIFGKYYRRLPKIGITRKLRGRLEVIMAFDETGAATPLRLQNSAPGGDGKGRDQEERLA